MKNKLEVGNLEALEFAVHKAHFGITVDQVQEIVTNKAVTKTPGTNRGVVGVFNIRDTIYTVIDLKDVLFGIPTEITKDTFFILTEEKYAYVVEGVNNIRKYNFSDVMASSTLIKDSPIQGILNFEDVILSILDLNKVLLLTQTELQETADCV